MRIFHFSDSHGIYVNLVGVREAYGDPDIWVCSGDFMRNFSRGKAGESQKQLKQYGYDADKLRGIFRDDLILCVDGNHDFVPVDYGLRSIGLNAVIVNNDRLYMYKGVSFAGFPHIPYIVGEWKHEAESDVLLEETKKALSLEPDVLVTHAPPNGILDRVGYSNCGNRALTSELNYGYVPKLHLFGHIHEQGGKRVREMNCEFVNSATTLQVIDYE